MSRGVKRSRFTEEQIIGILTEQVARISVSDLCRKHGVSDAIIYKWKAKLGGMDVSEAKRHGSIEDENAKLMRLMADFILNKATLKNLPEANGDALCRTGSCRAS
jgi:putative transposase